MPLWSSPRPSSSAAHSMPSEIDAEDAATLDRAAVGHRRAERRERHDVAGLHVERAAPHVAPVAVTGVDVDALHLGGVGMLSRGA